MKFDKTLSIFGNRVVRDMEMYQTSMLLLARHRVLYTMWLGAMDCYRHSIDLHFNAILSGRHANSKSFMLTETAKMFAPDTVSKLVAQTNAADAVDGDHLDRIDFFEEAPLSSFDPLLANDERVANTWKAKLTNPVVSIKVFHMDEDTGERSWRITRSLQIQTILAGTNDPSSKLQPSLRSRFHWFNFDAIFDLPVSMAALTMKSRCRTPAEEHIFEKFCREKHLEQYIDFMVEKMIYCTIMRDVSLDVADKLFPFVDKFCSTMGSPAESNRQLERMIMIERKQVIHLAIEELFFTPGAKYCGKEVTLEAILELEPLLYSRFETSAHTMGLLKEGYQDNAVGDIQHYLRQMYKGMGTIRVAVDGSTGEVDYNYFNTGKSILDLSREIHSLWMGSSVPDVDRIKQVFLDLLQGAKKISSKSYVDYIVGDKLPRQSGTLAGEFLILKHVRLPGSNTNTVHIFYGWITQKHIDDVVLSGIQSFVYGEMEEKKCLYGDSIPKHPHLFSVFPWPKKTHKMRPHQNPAGRGVLGNMMHFNMDFAEAQQRAEAEKMETDTVLDIDLDLYGVIQRLDRMFLPPDDHEQIFKDSYSLFRDMRANDILVGRTYKKEWEYPLGSLEEVKDREKKWKKMREDIVEGEKDKERLVILRENHPGVFTSLIKTSTGGYKRRHVLDVISAFKSQRQQPAPSSRPADADA